ncbi:MAG: archease [Thermoprotei archaeon]|nr:MAG: archease [Thermoprotei archaeon]
MDRGKIRFLPHTADVLIEVEGETLEEVFENAGLAVFEVMTDTQRVGLKESRKIEVEGIDLLSLLYNWIDKLIYYFDAEMLLFAKFNVYRIWQENGRYRLVAEAWGETYNSEYHESRTAVKAATYHLMEIREEKGRYIARFVVDI